MLKRNVIVGVGVIIRGRNLVLGGLCSGGLACFFGDSFGEGGGGGWGIWTVGLGIGDWGLSVMSKVLSGFWGIGWLVGRGWGVGWGWMGGGWEWLVGLSSTCAGGRGDVVRS